MTLPKTNSLHPSPNCLRWCMLQQTPLTSGSVYSGYTARSNTCILSAYKNALHKWQLRSCMQSYCPPPSPEPWPPRVNHTDCACPYLPDVIYITPSVFSVKFFIFLQFSPHHFAPNSYTWVLEVRVGGVLLSLDRAKLAVLPCFRSLC